MRIFCMTEIPKRQFLDGTCGYFRASTHAFNFLTTLVFPTITSSKLNTCSNELCQLNGYSKFPGALSLGMIFIPVNFLFLGLLFWSEYVEIGDSRRLKRLIGGDTIRDKERSVSPLDVLQYYTWIGLAHECYEDAPWWVRYFDWTAVGTPARIFLEALLRKLCPFEKPDHVVCGGALIAPGIVQTACHCVSQVYQNDKNNWGYFRLRTYLESDLFIYMGRSDVAGFYYPIKSKRFFAHPLCGYLRSEEPKYMRYDVGWIVLDEDVPDSEGVEKNYWGPLNYAGPFKKEALEKFYDRVLAERHVCLVTGYGRDREKGGIKSSTFRFGWIQILDYSHCFDVLWKSLGFDNWVPYSETGYSLVCSHPLDLYKAIPAQHWKADSGSPITCSNNYFALVSGINFFAELRVGFYNISRETGIRCSPESITIENRRQFEADIQIGRYRFSSVGSLRLLRLPNGSTVFPILRHRSMDFDVLPPMKPTFSSGGNYLSSALWSIFLSAAIY